MSRADRVELSAVLEAMGGAPEVGMGAVRFSLGRATTADETAPSNTARVLTAYR